MGDPVHEWLNIDGSTPYQTEFQDASEMIPQDANPMFPYQSLSAPQSRSQGHTYQAPQAAYPEATSQFSRYQPSQTMQNASFAVPSFPTTNNALNISQVQGSHAVPPSPSGNLGLSNLVPQEMMNWINMAEFNAGGISAGTNSVQRPDMAGTRNPSYASDVAFSNFAWPHGMSPVNGASNGTGQLAHLIQQSNQYQQQPTQQANTAVPQVSNHNGMLHDQTSIQSQGQQHNPAEECMKLQYWMQSGFPEIPLEQSTMSRTVPTQQSASGLGFALNMNGTQPVQKQRMNPTLQGFSAFGESSGLENAYPQGSQYLANPTSSLQTQPAQPMQSVPQNPTQIECEQFLAYAMAGPMPTVAAGTTVPRSDAYHQHTAVAGQMETLSMAQDMGNPASGQILSDLESYLMAPSRYALGERKIIIHTPRVGQRSYGTEKRFLCPPPTACVIGLPWWQADDKGTLRPPAINISITGEHSVPSSTPFWTTIQNKVYEETAKLRLPPSERPFVGKVSNKGLHISDGTEPKEDKKGRTIKAVMTVHCRREDGQLGKEIGSFESKEMKIVSKPSKKRSSVRTSDLFLQHGSLVTLFNRIKAQTSTTKFLAVTTNLRQLKGSDGKPLPLPAGLATTENAFVADHHAWDPFVMWLVDVNKPQARTEHPATPNAPFPPPSDAISLPSSKVIPIICFNHTVRLQCPSTGLITPVMVIRKVEGPQTVQAFEGSRKDNDATRCAVNELPGDPVCQLHKIAFELYAPPVAPHSPVYGPNLRSPGSWLSCDQEGISFQPGISARNWSSAPSTPPSRGSLQLSGSLPPSPGNHMSALQPMTPRSVVSNTLPSAPTSPVVMYSPNLPMGNGGPHSAGDYFAASRHHSSGSSTPYILASPQTHIDDLGDSGGHGPVRRRRTSSGASLASVRPSSVPTPMMRPPPPRKRGSQQSIHSVDKKENESDGLLWTIDVAESATWTIVGAESKTYTFWIPPHVEKLTAPVTPFPALNKYIPPGVAAETGHHLDKRYPGQFTTLVDAPLATFYGSGLGKKPDGEPLQKVYYGTQPAKHNEVRCQEVMNASVPEVAPASVPIFLVKTNGECIYPTPLTWTG